MAVIDKKTYAVAKRYTDTEIAGGGAIKGKNCTIDSIDPITGGNRVTFKWTLDNGTVQTGTMDVMDGTDGAPGATGAQGPQGPAGPAGSDGADGLGIKSVDINEENHLIITYDDDTTHDAGEIPGGGGSGEVISVNGKKGVVILYATDIKMSNDPSAQTIALTIEQLAGSMSGKASQSDVTQIQLDVEQLQGSLLNKVDKVEGKGLSENDFTDTDKDKLDALADIKSVGAGLSLDPNTGELEATGIAIEIDDHLDTESAHAIQNQAVAIPFEALQGSLLIVKSALDDKVDKVAGKGLSTEDFTTADKTALETTIPLDISALQGSLLTKADKSTTYTKTEVDTAVGAKLDADKVGSANGVAPLGSDSKVPAANLPSYVDDVEEYATKASFPVTGESGKIYVDLSDNKTYRWSGSTYVVVGNDLALGETSSTAYAGDKGKANADAISAIKDGSSIDSFADVESALTDKADKSTTYTKTEVDTALADKADKSTTYTKTEVDTSLGNKADKSTTYTKTEVDTALGNKADKSTTYTKTEVDTALGNKADKSTTYTKTEVNNALAAKANTTDVDSWSSVAYANSSGTVVFDNLSDAYAYKLFAKDRFPKISSATKGAGTTSGTIKLTYNTDCPNNTECYLRMSKKD